MTKIFRDLTRKFVGLNIKKSVLTTKMRVLTIKNRYLTMKLEPVLTMKIVDNFVRFGMPYYTLEFRVNRPRDLPGPVVDAWFI